MTVSFNRIVTQLSTTVGKMPRKNCEITTATRHFGSFYLARTKLNERKPTDTLVELHPWQSQNRIDFPYVIDQQDVEERSNTDLFLDGYDASMLVQS